MENIIGAIVLLAILGFAAFYVIRAKKHGQKCIGCPNGCCPHACEGCQGQCGANKE